LWSSFRSYSGSSSQAYPRIMAWGLAEMKV
jgi:hypothetical protein